MKFLLSLCLAALSLGLYGQRSQDIEGTWRWTSPNGEDNFELLLEYQDTNTLRGTHCAVFYNGEKRDCQREENVFSIKLVKVAKNIFDGTIESGISATAGRIRVQYNPKDVSVNFVLKRFPPGEFLLPAKAIMYR